MKKCYKTSKIYGQQTNLYMRVSDEQLQHVLDLCDKFSEEEAGKKRGIKQDTIRRYRNEAKKRGLKVSADPIKMPKIFVFDLENAPSKAAVWRMWKQNINNDQITEEWYMLSWAGKWLFGTETYSDVLTPEEAVAGKDGRIMESLWQFIDHADILVGHNINQFDVLKMNTRFVINDIMPPSPYQTVDTLYSAKRNFSFTSNKLDYLCKQFGVARKADNGGLKRWLGCCDGDPKDLLDMEKYNKQDIAATEELYLAMRPYIKSHPNLALYIDSDTPLCRLCGSDKIEWLYDEKGDPVFYYTTMNKYHSYRCKKCKGLGRSPHSFYKGKDKSHILSPVAR